MSERSSLGGGVLVPSALDILALGALIFLSSSLIRHLVRRGDRQVHSKDS